MVKIDFEHSLRVFGDIKEKHILYIALINILIVSGISAGIYFLAWFFNHPVTRTTSFVSGLITGSCCLALIVVVAYEAINERTHFQYRRVPRKTAMNFDGETPTGLRTMVDGIEQPLEPSSLATQLPEEDPDQPSDPEPFEPNNGSA